jgi:hypothetical protein
MKFNKLSSDDRNEKEEIFCDIYGILRYARLNNIKITKKLINRIKLTTMSFLEYRFSRKPIKDFKFNKKYKKPEKTSILEVENRYNWILNNMKYIFNDKEIFLKNLIKLYL